jgi:hypothetical protein
MYASRKITQGGTNPAILMGMQVINSIITFRNKAAVKREPRLYRV